MRQKNNALMQSIKQFAESYYLENKTWPSLSQISAHLKIGKTTAYRYIHTMHENGMLSYDGAQGVRTELADKIQCASCMVAVLGDVSCGLPKYADENIESYVELPRKLLGEGSFYLLRAKGDSMIGADINDGDLVLIRQQNTARDGDIVVALMEDEATLKTLFWDRQHKCIRLHPENPKYRDIVLKNVLIQGVAVKILKNVRRARLPA